MNLIVLCSDTFRVDHLSCYRNDSPVHTPNIDRLATEGVRFDAAFGEGIPTLPARRVLYTGRPIFPFLWAPQKWDRVQLAGWHPLFHEDVTLAEWLVERGYRHGADQRSAAPVQARQELPPRIRPVQLGTAARKWTTLWRDPGTPCPLSGSIPPAAARPC